MDERWEGKKGAKEGAPEAGAALLLLYLRCHSRSCPPHCCSRQRRDQKVTGYRKKKKRKTIGKAGMRGRTGERSRRWSHPPLSLQPCPCIAPVLLLFELLELLDSTQQPQHYCAHEPEG